MAESDIDEEALDQVAEYIADLIKASPEIVILPAERWDHVIHSLEENIDQLYGPREPVALKGGTEIQPTEELSDAQREEIGALEETLDLIMEQVTDGAEEGGGD